MFYSAAASMGSAPKSKWHLLLNWLIVLAASYMNKEKLGLPGPGAYEFHTSSDPLNANASIC